MGLHTLQIYIDNLMFLCYTDHSREIFLQDGGVIMKDTIGINETQMREFSKLMLKFHDDIHGIFMDYKNIIEHTATYYKGETAETFRDKFLNFYKNLDLVSESFLDYSNLYNEIVNRYQSVLSDSARTTMNESIRR